MKDSKRLDYRKAFPEAFEAMIGLQMKVGKSGLDPKIIELVKLRASQINGCAYCIDMHTKDARAMGETEQRLYLLNAWHEAPFYTEKERVALEWAETLTLVSTHRVTDELYEKAMKHFSEKELVDLTFAVLAMNSWNRLSVSFLPKVGGYQPGKH